MITNGDPDDDEKDRYRAEYRGTCRRHHGSARRCGGQVRLGAGSDCRLFAVLGEAWLQSLLGIRQEGLQSVRGQEQPVLGKEPVRGQEGRQPVQSLWRKATLIA